MCFSSGLAWIIWALLCGSISMHYMESLLKCCTRVFGSWYSTGTWSFPETLTSGLFLFMVYSYLLLRSVKDTWGILLVFHWLCGALFMRFLHWLRSFRAEFCFGRLMLAPGIMLPGFTTMWWDWSLLSIYRFGTSHRWLLKRFSSTTHFASAFPTKSKAILKQSQEKRRSESYYLIYMFLKNILFLFFNVPFDSSAADEIFYECLFFTCLFLFTPYTTSKILPLFFLLPFTGIYGNMLLYQLNWLR